MQQRGSSLFSLFFFLVLTVDYGLPMVGWCAAVVVIVVLEQKERERKNK